MAAHTFEPHVAEIVFREMLDLPTLTLVARERLDREKGCSRDGTLIVAIRTESGRTLRGRIFIDATYEGDLMAAAGVSFVVGRESNAQYGETLNGLQTRRNIHNHRFVRDVDPYVEPGYPETGLVAGVHGERPGREGQADHRVQAYCFRLCMTNVPQNRIPFAKPDGYDEREYELLFRNFEAGDTRVPMHAVMMPNGKTDTNNNGALSTDFIGMNYDYPEGTYRRRDTIVAAHRRYQQGLMWTLANHPRVPKAVRDEMSQWGLAKDEFTDNDHWPYQLYVREARRMVGGYVMTEHDCLRKHLVSDSVGLGSYNIDSHNTQRYVTDDGYVQNEGDVQVSPQGAYMISYRSVVPAVGEATNLLVPVCLSASHVAYGSIRMEPVFMILGQSAAAAAELAIELDVAVQDVPYKKLREVLLREKQVLDLPP